MFSSFFKCLQPPDYLQNTKAYLIFKNTCQNKMIEDVEVKESICRDILNFSSSDFKKLNSETFYQQLINKIMGEPSYFLTSDKKQSYEAIYKQYIGFFESASKLFAKLPLPKDKLTIKSNKVTYAVSLPYLLQNHRIPLPIAIAVSSRVGMIGSRVEDVDTIANLLKNPYMSFNFAVCLGYFNHWIFDTRKKLIQAAHNLLSQCKITFGSDVASARAFLNGCFEASGFCYIDHSTIVSHIHKASELLEDKPSCQLRAG